MSQTMSNDICYYKSEIDFHPLRLEKSWDVPESTVKLFKVLFFRFRISS